MGKFEYKTLIYTTSGWDMANLDTTHFNARLNELDHFDIRLNELGKKGWELDKCFPVYASCYRGTKNIVLIFKREIKQ